MTTHKKVTKQHKQKRWKEKKKKRPNEKIKTEINNKKKRTHIERHYLKEEKIKLLWKHGVLF